MSPSYEHVSPVDELADRCVVDEETARIFRTPEGGSLRLYRHQVEALERERAREGYVVTGGKGSG